MKEKGFEEVFEALQSLLAALEAANMEIPEVSALAEVIEEEQQERAKRLLDGW